MATQAQIGEALKRAHAAGDTVAAQKLATAYRSASPDPAPSINMSVSDRFAKMRQDNPQPAQPQQNVGDRLMDSTAASVNGFVNGIPIFGPLLQNTTDMMGGGIAQLTGGDYGEYIKRQQALREHYAKSAPAASLAGNIGGGLAAFGGFGALPGGAEALGVTATQGGLRGLVQQTGASLGSTLATSTVDNMVRGQRPADAMRDSVGMSGLAALVPGASAAVRATGRGIRSASQPLRNAMNERNAATQAIANNINKDRAVGSQMLSGAEEGALNASGAPVMNIDRFGEGIRRLGRAATNTGSEAGAILRDKAQQRFGAQSERAKSFLGTLMNGATDDLALQDALNDAAKKANKVNYDAARANPASRAVWNQPIKELMQSDSFIAAVNMAEKRGTDRAAAAGVKAVRNPFDFRPDGTITLKTNADGTRALPSLDFWDQVKRNLDGMIGQAKRNGDNTLTGDLTGLKRKLTQSLDAAVPEYKTARGVAASFFGADDAIDAGRKAATSTRQNAEIGRAVQGMSKAEHEAFSVGYASEVIDMLGERGNRMNVINSLFDKPAAMERMKIALGPQKSREFEAYVRGEQIIDMTRVALAGNSSTAQQLMDLGIGLGVSGAGGIGAYFASGGNMTQAGLAALMLGAGRKGMQMLGKRTDEQIMKHVAEMLASTDPKDVQRAVQNASMSQSHIDAMRAIMRGLETGTRGAVMGSGANSKPVETINGPVS